MTILPILVLASGLAAGSEGSRDALPDGAGSLTPVKSMLYTYRMKGMVRILFFWMKKDRVGGGWIGLNQFRTPHSSSSVVNEIEVLFGSNPKRVHGINRWGYGREQAYWESSFSGAPRLERTVFEGFMRKSREGSAAEVVQNREVERKTKLYRYQGIRSIVLPRRARSEIREFARQEDLGFRQFSSHRLQFIRSLHAGRPDRLKELDNQVNLYQNPMGFLTSVQRVLGDVAADYRHHASVSRSRLPRIVYVYNAQLYWLRVIRVKHHRKLEIPVGHGSASRKEAIPDLLEVKLEAREVGTMDGHDFAVWMPLSGRYAGVPVRIVDYPRWWLKVELTLDLSRVDAEPGPDAKRLVPLVKVPAFATGDAMPQSWQQSAETRLRSGQAAGRSN